MRLIFIVPALLAALFALTRQPATRFNPAPPSWCEHNLRQITASEKSASDEQRDGALLGCHLGATIG